jgi:hypothetical protein
MHTYIHTLSRSLFASPKKPCFERYYDRDIVLEVPTHELDPPEEWTYFNPPFTQPVDHIDIASKKRLRREEYVRSLLKVSFFLTLK